MDPSLKKSIAEELDEPPASLTSETILADLANWDSVAALTIMVMIGDAVGVPIDPDDMARLETFGDIERLVAAKMGA